MTKPYAARRLLEHGQLTFAEMLEITGWKKQILFHAIKRCMERGEVRRVCEAGCSRYVYTVA
jgi:hypothetical protein